MGLYTEKFEDEDLDMSALVEAFMYDDLVHNYSEETVREFCAPGGVGEALFEAGVLKSNRSFVRLGKQSDLHRREVITAIQLARKHHDPLFDKLVKYQMLKKQTRAKIMKKYGSKAAKIALKGQKEYIKSMKGVNVSNIPNSAFISNVTKDANR